MIKVHPSNARLEFFLQFIDGNQLADQGRQNAVSFPGLALRKSS